jgi:hypothetical protein
MATITVLGLLTESFVYGATLNIEVPRVKLGITDYTPALLNFKL